MTLKERSDVISGVVAALTALATLGAAVIRYHADIMSIMAAFRIELAIILVVLVLVVLARWTRAGGLLAHLGPGEQVAILVDATRQAYRSRVGAGQAIVLILGWLGVLALLLSVLGYGFVVTKLAVDQYNSSLRLQMINSAVKLEKEARYYDAQQELKDVIARFPAHPDNDELERKLGELTARGELLARLKAWKDLPANGGQSLRKYENGLAVCILSPKDSRCAGLDVQYKAPAAKLVSILAGHEESCAAAASRVPAAERFLLMDRADRLWIGADETGAFGDRLCRAMSLTTSEELGSYLSSRWGGYL